MSEGRWPFPHVWRFGAFGGGWAGYTCDRCGSVGVGKCLWERLFRPCRLNPKEEK